MPRLSLSLSLSLSPDRLYSTLDSASSQRNLELAGRARDRASGRGRDEEREVKRDKGRERKRSREVEGEVERGVERYTIWRESERERDESIGLISRW